jgi:hypothetical protein
MSETNDSKHGLSRDAIAWRLGQLEDTTTALLAEMKEITLCLARLERGCPMAGQCSNLVTDVKAMQEDRFKAKGVLWSIGIVCTALGAVVGPFIGEFAKLVVK